jgi:Tol biopolymer transport system component
VKPIRGGLLLAVALLLLALAPAISWAAYPGANGRIAYAGYPSGEVFTVLPDGSGIQPLTDDPDQDHYPSWSADGRWITYLRDGPTSYHVFTIRADGEHETKIVRSTVELKSPHFSPNGRRILYLRSQSITSPRTDTILKVRRDGTERRRVITSHTYLAWPSYSPNGKRIIFAGTPKGKHVGGIWTIHPDGSHLHRLTWSGNRHYGQMPEWSPDGRHIIFARCDLGSSVHYCEGDLVVMRSDGSHKHRIWGWVGDTSPPAFSPNGNRIALVTWGSDGFNDYCSDIYTITRTGRDPKYVTGNCEDFDNGGPGGFAVQPSWQPIPQP